MAFDLANLDTRAACEAGAKLELVHPGTKAPLEATITLAGTDADSYRASANARADARMAAAQRGKTLRAEDAQADHIALLAAATKGWKGIQENGKDIPFSEKEARRVYEQYPWIAEQVGLFISDRANFLPA